MTVDRDKTGEITRTSEPSKGAVKGHLVWIKGCTERYLIDQRRKMEHKSASLSHTIYSVVHISHNIKISIDKNAYKADLRYNATFYSSLAKVSVCPHCKNGLGTAQETRQRTRANHLAAKLL